MSNNHYNKVQTRKKQSAYSPHLLDLRKEAKLDKFKDSPYSSSEAKGRIEKPRSKSRLILFLERTGHFLSLRAALAKAGEWRSNPEHKVGGILDSTVPRSSGIASPTTLCVGARNDRGIRQTNLGLLPAMLRSRLRLGLRSLATILKTKFRFPRFNINFSSLRSGIIIFVIISLVIVFPVKGITWYQGLKSKQKEITNRTIDKLKSSSADDIFINLKSAISGLQAELNQFNPLLLEAANLSPKFKSIKNKLAEAAELTRLAEQLLGYDRPMRYLVVFQNNNELRATGGFMGSFALIDIKQGKIKNVEMPAGGSYDLKGELTVNLEPPFPLTVVNEQFQFQDANFWPDFPASAQKILWFYEKSGGPTVDGLIAVNASLVPKLLEITGPIITLFGEARADNFITEAQKYSRLESGKEGGKGKAYLSALAPLLLEKLSELEKTQLINLIKTLSQAARQKEIQAYFPNSKFQKFAETLKIDGQIIETSSDYLYLVHSNIGGGKTDEAIDNLIHLVTEIDNEGNVSNTLEITRIHKGDKNNPIAGQRNIDYLRVYIPRGSKLIFSEGFIRPERAAFKISLPPAYIFKTEQFEEAGKFVFADWLMVMPQDSKTATLKYVLPQKIKFYPTGQNASYKLFIQKQPGLANATFQHTVKLSPEWQAKNLFGIARENTVFNPKDNTIKTRFSLEKDTHLLYLLGK